VSQPLPSSGAHLRSGRRLRAISESAKHARLAVLVKVAPSNRAFLVNVAVWNPASLVKVALPNQAFPVKVAPPNQAFPVKVAPPNQAAPVKVAPPNWDAPVKVAPPNWDAPVKVAPPNQAAPVTVAPSNPASPLKVALPNPASPLKVASPNWAFPVKVAPPNWASSVKVASPNWAAPVKVAPSNRASSVKNASPNRAGSDEGCPVEPGLPGDGHPVEPGGSGEGCPVEPDGTWLAVGQVDVDEHRAGQVEGAIGPERDRGMLGIWSRAQMIGEDTLGGQPHLPFLDPSRSIVGGTTGGFDRSGWLGLKWLVGHAQVGAQHVDNRLAVGGAGLGQAFQRIQPPEAHRGLPGVELLHGFAVELGDPAFGRVVHGVLGGEFLVPLAAHREQQ
jgi:hypothetical protein